MGNKSSSSCFDSCSGIIQSIKTSKLIDPQGNVLQIPLPVTAADLMLGSPGYLVASADELLETWTIVAVKADEKLREKKVYMLVSADKIGTMLSTLQLIQIRMALYGSTGGIRSGLKKRVGASSCCGGAQVLPVVGGSRGVGSRGKVVIVARQDSRWTPVLEMISEDNK